MLKCEQDIKNLRDELSAKALALIRCKCHLMLHIFPSSLLTTLSGTIIFKRFSCANYSHKIALNSKLKLWPQGGPTCCLLCFLKGPRRTKLRTSGHQNHKPLFLCSCCLAIIRNGTILQSLQNEAMKLQ